MFKCISNKQFSIKFKLKKIYSYYVKFLFSYFDKIYFRKKETVASSILKLKNLKDNV